MASLVQPLKDCCSVLRRHRGGFVCLIMPRIKNAYIPYKKDWQALDLIMLSFLFSSPHKLQTSFSLKALGDSCPCYHPAQSHKSALSTSMAVLGIPFSCSETPKEQTPFNGAAGGW